MYTPATLSPSSTPGLATPNGFGFTGTPDPPGTSPGYARAAAAATTTNGPGHHNRASLPSAGLVSPTLPNVTVPHSPDGPASAGGTFRRPFLPAVLTRKQLGAPSDGSHPGGLVSSAITGMRSLSMGIESWRKHSTTASASASALGTEYEDLVRREADAAAVARSGGTASVNKMDLPSPRRRSSEPDPDPHLRELYRMGIPVKNLDAEYPPAARREERKASVMSGKNVKGLRLPVADINVAAAAAVGEESPGRAAGLLSPALISASGSGDGDGDGATSPLAVVPLGSPLSMGEASKGTRRKPVPATFATVRRVSGEAGR